MPPARVTAIVCTRDRPEGLRAALASAVAQDRAPDEIVVVDDGAEAALIGEPGLPTTVVRLGGAGPGAARAAGLDAARYDLVAWCDDDDTWSSDHLAVLAGHLDDHPEIALAYGDAEWWQDGASKGVPWSMDYDVRVLRYENAIFPSTAVARTEALRAAGGFDAALEAYEDWDLWLRLGLDRRLWHVRRTLGRMAWSLDGVAAAERWDVWARVQERHSERMAALGPAVDHALAEPAAPVPAFDPATWRDGRRELLWHSILRVDHSFGVVSRQLVEALERRGVDVRAVPTLDQPLDDLRRLYREPDGRGRLGFYYDFRRRPRIVPSQRIVNYAMWESTQLPPGDVEELNAHVALQLVPSRRNRETYLAAGVEVPVEVLPHGVDGDRFPLLERPGRETLTFGTFSDFSPRKGIDVLVRAFTEEFRDDEPVRLLLRSSRGGHGFGSDDPRVELFTGHTDQFRDPGGLHELLRRMDVFVLPSRGEPWGMPGIEAMATGLPLIATDWDGPADYMTPEDCLPLRYRLVDCDGVVSNSTVYHGQWAEPDLAHLRERLRWCFEHRDALGDMGARGAARVRREFSWDRAAETLVGYLDALAARG